MTSSYLGPKWGAAEFGSSGGAVTWSFAQLGGVLTAFNAIIDDPAFQSAVRAAFDLWESVAVIDLVEVPDSGGSDIRLGWASIDGPSNTIGYAESQYWLGTNTFHYSEISFDTAESWKANVFAGAADAIDFLSVAVHEIGHALGLDHSGDQTSIMAPVYGGLTNLSPEDLAGIQNLYGGRFFAPEGSAGAITGTASSDLVTGGDFADTVSAGTGSDTVTSGTGSDVVYGNQGGDTLFGNQGEDLIFGGQESDEIYGGLDADQLFGNLGDDAIFGNLGNDWLHGGQGGDQIHGGQGDDLVNGGAGDDVLSGDLGADIFVFVSGQGSDVVSDLRFEEGDRLDLQGQTIGSVAATADGDAILALSGGGTVVLLGLTPDEFEAAYVA